MWNWVFCQRSRPSCRKQAVLGRRLRLCGCVYAFIVVPKRFRRLQQLELWFYRIFITYIGRWEFFFSFLGAWWDWVSWWVATPSVHHGIKHNDLSVEILSFILVERGLMMILSKFDSEDAIRKTGRYVEVLNTYMAVHSLFILGPFGRVKWSLLKLSTMLYHVSRPLFGFWGK